VTILLLTWPTVSMAMTASLPDSLQIVPKQLLRDATKRIDQLDLRVLLLTNRVAERDSIISSRGQEMAERVAAWQEYAEAVASNSAAWFTTLFVSLALAGGVWLGIWAQKQ